MIKKELYYLQIELNQSTRIIELSKIDKGLFTLKSEESLKDIITYYMSELHPRASPPFPDPAPTTTRFSEFKKKSFDSTLEQFIMTPKNPRHQEVFNGFSFSPPREHYPSSQNFETASLENEPFSPVDESKKT